MAAGAATAPLLKKYLPANVHNLLPLIRQWPSICPALASFSQPKEVKLGVLKVAAANASVAQQLQFEAPTVLELARLATGQNLTKLVTVIAPLATGLDKPAMRHQSASQQTDQSLQNATFEVRGLAQLVAQLKVQP